MEGQFHPDLQGISCWLKGTVTLKVVVSTMSLALLHEPAGRSTIDSGYGMKTTMLLESPHIFLQKSTLQQSV